MNIHIYNSLIYLVLFQTTKLGFVDNLDVKEFEPYRPTPGFVAMSNVFHANTLAQQTGNVLQPNQPNTNTAVHIKTPVKLGDKWVLY